MIGLNRWVSLSPVSFIRQVRVVPNEWKSGKDSDSDPKLDLDADGGIGRSLGLFPEFVGKYADFIREHYIFHHNFWMNNNIRYSKAKAKFLSENPTISVESKEMAQFYRQYMLTHRVEFANYHRQAWRRTFAMLFTEYKFGALQLFHFLKRAWIWSFRSNPNFSRRYI